MRVLLAILLASGVIAISAALLDLMLFINHPTVKAGPILWTCVRIGGTRQFGCLSD